MLGGSGPNTIFALVQNAPIGPDHFTSIARINHSPAVFAVKAEAPWKSFREVVDYMKRIRESSILPTPELGAQGFSHANGRPGGGG